MITKHENRDRFPRRRGYGISLRRGVTLIELMFAIGILLVGLLGVAALIPLAGWEIGRGLTADRMAAAGRNAVQEFDIRNMRRNDMYAWWNPNTNSWASFTVSPDSVTAFCIDPLGIGEDLNWNGTLDSGEDLNGNGSLDIRGFFPLPGLGTRMPRVVLRDRPGGTIIMDRKLAERIFVARDDLAVDRPVNPTSPPEQVYGTAQSQRQYNGSFSWFATLVKTVNTNLSDQYVLSIVVLEDRDRQAAEQELRVSYLGGRGGGEVVLTGQFDLRTGNWLMLTAPGPGGSPDIFRWYRVVNSALDEELDLNGNGTVDSAEDIDGNGQLNAIEFVTLEGADIDFIPNSAVLVRGVVGVFEKTIRLEGSSMWDTTP
jgi:prepilin-type N-terminal cleavage/methylation domain-containing protein